jgi:hypothetical protein
MTTLIYRDGVVAADRRYGVPACGKSMVFIDRPKVHLHPTKKIAYGICGAVKGKDAQNRIGDYLLGVATQLEQGEVPDMAEVLADWSVDGINLILLTRNYAWLIILDETDNKVKVTDLDDLPFYAVGSGQWSAFALMNEGATFDKIFSIVPKIDGLTGPRYDSYKKTQLRSLRTTNARRNKRSEDLLPGVPSNEA